MAKQAGDIFITGTIDDLCFYKMDGKHYVRMKSSLTGKRFRNDKAFEGSRKSCERFTSGNKIASKVYALLEEDKKSGKLISFLRSRAIRLLKEGKGEKEAEELLIDYLVEFGLLKPQEEETTVEDKSRKKYYGSIRIFHPLPFYNIPVRVDSGWNRIFKSLNYL